MNARTISIIAQLSGLGILLSQLTMDVPRLALILGLMLMALPLFIFGDKMRRDGYLLLLSGLAVVMTAVAAELYILWFVGGLALMLFGGQMVARAMLAEIRERANGSQK